MTTGEPARARVAGWLRKLTAAGVPLLHPARQSRLPAGRRIHGGHGLPAACGSGDAGTARPALRALAWRCAVHAGPCLPALSAAWVRSGFFSSGAGACCRCRCDAGSPVWPGDAAMPIRDSCPNPSWDVTLAAVVALLRSTQADVLGPRTYAPARRASAGRGWTRERARIVLGDWPERGKLLVLDAWGQYVLQELNADGRIAG